jgi:hypothetical protein
MRPAPPPRPGSGPQPVPDPTRGAPAACPGNVSARRRIARTACPPSLSPARPDRPGSAVGRSSRNPGRANGATPRPRPAANPPQPEATRSPHPECAQPLGLRSHQRGQPPYKDTTGDWDTPALKHDHKPDATTDTHQVNRGYRVAPSISARGSHRSVRKPLGLYGTCHPDHQTLGTAGTHSQCANMRGNRLTIPRQHRKAVRFARNRLYFLRIQRTR